MMAYVGYMFESETTVSVARYRIPLLNILSLYIFLLFSFAKITEESTRHFFFKDGEKYVHLFSHISLKRKEKKVILMKLRMECIIYFLKQVVYTPTWETQH